MCTDLIFLPLLLFSCNRIDVFVKAFHFNWDDSRDWYDIDMLMWFVLGLHCVSWLLKDLFCWNNAQRFGIVMWGEKLAYFLGLYRIQILSLIDCLTSGKLLNLPGSVGGEKLGFGGGDVELISGKMVWRIKSNYEEPFSAKVW